VTIIPVTIEAASPPRSTAADRDAGQPSEGDG